jgi:ABC-type amino acid transport substrate-binding protein
MFLGINSNLSALEGDSDGDCVIDNFDKCSATMMGEAITDSGYTALLSEESALELLQTLSPDKKHKKGRKGIKKMKRLVLLLVLFYLLSLQLVKASEEKNLVITIDKNYPPFSLLNVDGKPVGMWVDIWKLWAKKTGQTIEFLPLSWNDTLHALEDQKADIHSGLFRHENRKTWMEFSEPFYEIGTGLYYSTKLDAPPILEKLPGKPVGTVKGSYQENWLRQSHPQLKLMTYPDQKEGTKAIDRGELVAFIGEEPTMEHALCGTKGC